MGIEVYRADTDGRGVRVGIAQARFNEPLCDALREACLAELTRLGVDAEDIFVCSVPGALEVPGTLELMGKTRQFDALIGLGAVVRGETYHFEVVSNESAAGLTRLAQDFSLPVVNGILTVDDDAQGQARASEKGADAARVAVEMANLAEYIEATYGDDDDDEDEDDDDDDDDEDDFDEDDDDDDDAK